MNFTKRSMAMVCTAGVLFLSTGVYAAFTQDKHDKKPADAAADEMMMPKPGPEHAMLAKAVGKWDAKVTNYFSGAPETSTGTSTTRSVGGLWFVTDFEGTMMGGPFSGHEVMGYDTTKKKFVSTWVDTWTTNFSNSEGTYDAATKTLTSHMDMVQMGETVHSTTTTVFKDDDHMTFTMRMPGPDGKEMDGLVIEYTRHK